MKLHFDSRQEFQPEAVKAIAKVGHDTELFKADNVTYESLAECCNYRK